MLNALLLIPLVGALVIGCWPGKLTSERARNLGLVFLGINLVFSLYVLSQFDLSITELQFRESIPWIDHIGLNYELGIDGLSLPLLIINSLLSLVSVYASEKDIRRPRLYYPLLLVIAFAVAGAFAAQNLLLFFIFYEIELIPLYLLIAIWGGAQRGYAATKFLIYTAISGILILASFLGLVWLSGSSGFDYNPTMAHGLPWIQQAVLLVALLIGFGIKIPLFPLHTWLPDAHVQASTPISVLLAGVLLKLGTYGLFRFGVVTFSEVWVDLAPYLAWWAVVSVLYGSLAAIAQTDMKKMVAYSSVGHMGYVLLAAAASNPLSYVGTVFQMLSHGIISALLFLVVGVVYKKTGTRDLTVLRGLLNPERGLPIVGSAMVLAVMASAGIPGMVGFISEFIVYRGSFVSFAPQTLLCLLGSGLTAVYFLLLVNRAFFGRLAITEDRMDEQDPVLPVVTWQDRLPALVLVGLLFVFGLSPSWMTRWIEPTTTAMYDAMPIKLEMSSAHLASPLANASMANCSDGDCAL
ncbi:MAG: NADH-quinone oxidoreductase subunit M [Leptolyngbyaceae cyanobacterium MAG.088]|nr:NADH-quinone oxidoreductase subunit M [Leptolyngbyaceae cyanobacterium MAG.088]